MGVVDIFVIAFYINITAVALENLIMAATHLNKLCLLASTICTSELTLPLQLVITSQLATFTNVDHV